LLKNKYKKQNIEIHIQNIKNNKIVEIRCNNKKRYNLLELFVNTDNIDKLKEKLLEFNGSFCIIINSDNDIFCAVDRLRSLPLFYKIENGNIFLTDNINMGEIKKDTPEYYEFLLSGYTINDSTLLESFKQIQSSEIIHFNKVNNQLEKLQYFKHTHQHYLDIKYKDYYKYLSEITDNFIKRLVISVGDKTIVLPLSGGYDSRYILAGLKKYNFQNVICYTYGNKDSFEVSIASQVAENLGYKLIVIEYTKKKWKNLLKNKKFLDYINYSFNYTSLPHIQDFIAIEELTRLNLIPKDSVIVPGFCGDFLGGSYIPIEVKENKIDDLLKLGIQKYILKKHFSNLSLPMTNNLSRILLNKLEISEVIDATDFISKNESFVTEHKLSKFIVNAVRPYEFFGYEWRMPLWDNELMEYWYKVPNEMRIDNRLYNDFLFDNLFDDQQIGFKKSKPVSHNKFIMKLRQILPSFILIKLKKIYHTIIYRNNKSDINNFEIFGDTIQSDIKIEKEIRFNNINGLFAYWILNGYKK
jgi:asparagine synthase (glutamine-hydrolysing)